MSLDYSEAVKYAYNELDDYNESLRSDANSMVYFSSFLFSALSFGVALGISHLRDIQKNLFNRWHLAHGIKGTPFICDSMLYLDEDTEGNLFGGGAGLDFLVQQFFEYIDKSGVETSYTFIKEYYKKHGIPQEFASYWVEEDKSFDDDIDMEIYCMPGTSTTLCRENFYVNYLVSDILLLRVNSSNILYTSSYFMLKKLKDADLLINSSTTDNVLKLLSSSRFMTSCITPLDLEETIESFSDKTKGRGTVSFSPKIPIIKLVPTTVDEQFKFKVVTSRDFYPNFKRSKLYFNTFLSFEHIWKHFKAIFTKYPMRVTLKNGREFVVTYNSEILKRYYAPTLVEKWVSSKVVTPYYIKFKIPTVSPVKGLIDLDLYDIVRMEVESSVLLQDLSVLNNTGAHVSKTSIPENMVSTLSSYAAQDSEIDDTLIDSDLASAYLCDKVNSGYLLDSELKDLAKRLGVNSLDKGTLLRVLSDNANSITCKDYILESNNFSRSDILQFQNKFGTLYKKESIPKTIEGLRSLLKTGIFKIERRTDDTVVVTNSPKELSRVLSMPDDDYMAMYESDSIVVNKALGTVKKLIDSGHKSQELLSDIKELSSTGNIPKKFGDWKPKYLGELYHLLLAKKISLQSVSNPLQTKDNEVVARDVRAMKLEDGTMAVHDYYVKIALSDIKSITRLTQV